MTMGSGNKGNGDGIEFLRRHVLYEGDDCVMWPLYREPRRGYGIIGYLGRAQKAHRLMCELAHGAPPFPEAEASHSCGNGHLGCVNPKHLSWKTRSENQQERRKHGTHGRNGDTKRYKLTLKDVSEIRALLGTMTTQEIAERYGVTRSNIRQIQLGKTWGVDKPVPREFSDDEVRAIRQSQRRLTDLASDYGVGRSVIRRIRNRVTYKDVSA